MAIPPTSGGPIMIATIDGRLLVGYVKVPLPFFRRWLGTYGNKRRRLLLRDVGSWHGAVDPTQIALLALSLQPRGGAFAVNTLETFSSGEDERVSVHDLSGDQQFFATDISVPPMVWRGDDPAAPALILDVQASVDVDWQSALKDDPSLPRWIVEGQFVSDRPGDSLRVAGWDADDCLLVEGQAYMELRCVEAFGADPLDAGPFGWWGRVAPNGNSAWAWAERTFGHPPAPATPSRRRTVRIDLVGSQLRVDGIVQTDPELAAGVMAFDGPFT